MRTFVYLFIALLALCSCDTVKRSVYEQEPVIIEKIQYRDRVDVRTDSVYVHDSVFLKVTADTVFLTNYKTRYVERLRHDTISMIDSIPVPYEVEIIKETVKRERMPLSGWFGYSIMLIVIYEGLKLWAKKGK